MYDQKIIIVNISNVVIFVYTIRFQAIVKIGKELWQPKKNLKLFKLNEDILL